MIKNVLTTLLIILAVMLVLGWIIAVFHIGEIVYESAGLPWLLAYVGIILSIGGINSK